LLGAEAPQESADLAPAERPVLLVRGDGRADLVLPDGRTLLSGRRLDPAALPSWRSGNAGASIESAAWATSHGALYLLADLRAADVLYGRLHIVASLADVQRGAALTRTLFYGLIGASFVVLLLLLNLLIARIVIAPVRRVMQAMREASTGALHVRLRVPAQDEIGAMAASFNLMVEDLAASKHEVEDYSRNLEHMVAERTRALRESEHALQRVSQHLATVIENVGTGVIALDDAGHVTTFNRRAAEILGLREVALAGRSLDALLADGPAKALLDSLRQVRQVGGQRRESEIVLRLPRGRRTLSLVVSALRGGGYVLVLDDLTELLASQRLAAWKEAVEKVIHEIKNPLTPVGLAAQTLQNAYVRDRARFDEIFPAAIDMVLNSVRDLKALIAEFTQFSRLPRAVPRRLDLAALLAETLAPYVTAEAPETRLRLQPAPALPAVEGDADQLRRVLLNVVHNALEAMHGRAGEVLVSAAPRAGLVELRVRDQGPGVEDVERLFEPYYTTKVKGTGLGLLIARQIVEEHGGTIRVASEPGVGTEVTIALPALPEI
jgi:PAS domain S-box-containing protein